MTEIVKSPDESPTSETCKLRDFFAAYTDTAAIEASGVTPARGSAVRTAPTSTPTQRTRTQWRASLRLWQSGETPLRWFGLAGALFGRG